MVKGISVVIPNYNGKALLEKNLPSVLFALDRFGKPFEVIVADDDSDDGSIEFLEQQYPSVVLVKNNTNLGFSKNINSGLKLAQQSLILALNNDVSLDPDYFKYQLNYFDAPDTFGVMGALCDPNSGKLQDAAKKYEQTWWGKICSTKNLMPLDGTNLPTLFLSGANALFDRSKLAKLDYFNELFSPFYNEDVELGIRAWRMGWRCYFEPRAKAFHSVSQTIGSNNSKSTIRRTSIRNRFFLHFIHLSGIQKHLFFFVSWLNLLFRWALADLTFYKAFFDFWTSLKTVKLARDQFGNLIPPFRLNQVRDVLESEQRKKKCFVF